MNEINQPPDRISLSALKSGDRSEFARMVELYSKQIYTLALRILGNQHDAEDVLQETFLKAYKGISAFEGRSSLSTWLYRIATNEALMIIRKRKPELNLGDPGRNDDEEELEEPYQFKDWCCLPEKEFQTSETREYMNKAISRLSSSLQVVFILRDLQGFSVKETADILGVNEGVVKTRLLRARLQLREELTAYFGGTMMEIK